MPKLPKRFQFLGEFSPRCNHMDDHNAEQTLAHVVEGSSLRIETDHPDHFIAQSTHAANLPEAWPSAIRGWGEFLLDYEPTCLDVPDASSAITGMPAWRARHRIALAARQWQRSRRFRDCDPDDWAAGLPSPEALAADLVVAAMHVWDRSTMAGHVDALVPTRDRTVVAPVAGTGSDAEVAGEPVMPETRDWLAYGSIEALVKAANDNANAWLNDVADALDLRLALAAWAAAGNGVEPPWQTWAHAFDSAGFTEAPSVGVGLTGKPIQAKFEHVSYNYDAANPEPMAPLQGEHLYNGGADCEFNVETSLSPHVAFTGDDRSPGDVRGVFGDTEPAERRCGLQWIVRGLLTPEAYAPEGGAPQLRLKLSDAVVATDPSRWLRVGPGAVRE